MKFFILITCLFQYVSGGMWTPETNSAAPADAAVGQLPRYAYIFHVGTKHNNDSFFSCLSVVCNCHECKLNLCLCCLNPAHCGLETCHLSRHSPVRHAALWWSSILTRLNRDIITLCCFRHPVIPVSYLSPSPSPTPFYFPLQENGWTRPDLDPLPTKCLRAFIMANPTW